MNGVQTFSTAFNCTVSTVTVEGSQLVDDTPPAPIKPLTIAAELTFSDSVYGELSKLLMPLKLTVQTTFYAEVAGPQQDLQLGVISFETIADVFTYAVRLVVTDPELLRRLAEQSYPIKGIVRVGTSPFAMPSLLRGYIGNLPHYHREPQPQSTDSEHGASAHHPPRSSLSLESLTVANATQH